MPKSDNQERDNVDASIAEAYLYDLACNKQDWNLFVSELRVYVQQTRTALVDEVLGEGPEDAEHTKNFGKDYAGWSRGYNRANAAWRSLLLKKRGQ